MSVFYNDIDPFACDWLAQLISAQAIAVGEVSAKSIVDLRGEDVEGFEQCHFFAGIGGWPLALDLAGWCGPCWTGSVPCQPLSLAGKHQGHADERHLWPAFHALIDQCKPATIFGEQVASKAGREWFAGIRADLEDSGYAVGCADLPAASIGAPHIRQRLWWAAQRLDHAARPRREGDARCRSEDQARHQAWLRRSQPRSADGGMGDADRAGRGEPRRPIAVGETFQTAERGSGGVWGNTFVLCTDRKARRVEPAIHPLADVGTVRNRVGTLRGAGNAICPQIAAEFVMAFMEARDD